MQTPGEVGNRFPYESTTLREVTLSSPPHQRAVSGFVIRRKEAESKAPDASLSACNSPRAVADNASLSVQTSLAAMTTLVIAADDADQHAAWIKFLSQQIPISNVSYTDSSPTSSDASSAQSPTVFWVTNNTNTTGAAKPSTSPKLTSPPRDLLCSLIQGNLHDELADRMRETRRALLSSRHDIVLGQTTTNGPSSLQADFTPAHAALSELQAALLGCSRHVNCVVDENEIVEPLVVDWLQAMSMYVAKCSAAYDEVLMGRGGTFYGGVTAVEEPMPSWSVTALTAAYVLQDIEYALREGCREILKISRRPSSAMAYFTWWARKKSL